MAVESAPSTYPPQPRNTHTRADAGPSFAQSSHPLASYLVTTETQSVADLRLQITQDPNGPSQSQSSFNATPSAPLRPIFFRERTLTAQDEIVDRLIDATTAQAVWTIHRPTRGWYLHLRSPALPPTFTIPIRPARPEFVTSTMGVQDPTSTPLTFSLGTRIHQQPLARCREWIGHLVGDHTPSHTNTKHTQSDDFTAVELNGTAEPTQQPTTSDDSTSFTKGHNARTSSVSSAAVQSAQQRHTRRRSAATSAGPSPGPSPNPDTRRMNLSGTFPQVSESAEGEGQEEQGQSSQPPHNSTARSPRHLSPHHPPDKDRSSPGDQPYRTPSVSTPQDNNRPTQCYFLLLDGAARTPPKSTSTALSAPGRIPASASERSSTARLGWAKWVWSLVPEPVRPPLAFDTSKSFSIRWIDVPKHHDHQPTSIEVMRYEDLSGYWLWQSKTRGRFVLQQDAVRALGIDEAFWFAVALAYLEFLEERDGYNAASDG